MNYHALLIDLDGVLRRWPERDAAIEAAHDLPRGSLRATAFAPELLAQAVTGRIDDGQWREQVAARLRAAHPRAQVDDAVRQWSLSCGEVDAPVLTLLEACRPGLRRILVSNATSRLPRDLDALGLSRHFDAIVNSSEVGAAKPGTALFQAAFDRADAAPQRLLFVDDDARNVAAAAALGVNAHHYRGVASMRQWLEEAGALDG
ncbi:HAD-IA family hydrolase [Lysobacter sp. Root690]|uniref:HAD-IA family hydrolase n=1 Tax=Lysobacter sp. Root690 TaxID=1736588 RepID=UPI0006FFEC0D|nr:HAD-IA family hydrolase [Lysobacter sp. Root690]KRB11185.1 hypothetical protein ASD86_01760 [Lysobacter sp. Root690]